MILSASTDGTHIWIRTAAVSLSGPTAGGQVGAAAAIRARDGAGGEPPGQHPHQQAQSSLQHLHQVGLESVKRRNNQLHQKGAWSADPFQLFLCEKWNHLGLPLLPRPRPSINTFLSLLFHSAEYKQVDPNLTMSGILTQICVLFFCFFHLPLCGWSDSPASCLESRTPSLLSPSCAAHLFIWQLTPSLPPKQISTSDFISLSCDGPPLSRTGSVSVGQVPTFWNLH